MSGFRNRLYYGLKPLIPAPTRHLVRKWIVRRQRRQVEGVWPILPGSERPPADWPGWPEGKKFAFVLTHDVEGRAGMEKCLRLMELEMKCGFRSSFNFIPEGNYRVSREMHEDLNRNGFETGIHDLYHDGRLYQNRRHFAMQAVQINQHLKHWGAVGFRSGFMLHNLEWLHDLDIQYDASTFDTDPFEPQPDNIGTIFPFWVSGLRGRGYLELPYTLPQDSTLFLLLGETSPEIWFQKLDWIAEKGGMALINVHPDYLRFPDEPATNRTYPVAYYEELLKRVADRYAGQYWNVLPKDLARWHRSVHAPVEDKVEPARNETGGQFVPALAAAKPLSGQRAAVILYADYASDARPRREAEALVKNGMEVDVISLCEDDTMRFRNKIDGVNLYQIPLKRRRSRKLVYILQYAWFLTASFFLLSSLSLKRRYRLVHVHNMPDFLVFSALLPRLRGARVILDLHDPMPELFHSIFGFSENHWLLRALKKIERKSIAFVDLVLTPNKAFKELFASRSCEADKIKIVMNSPNTTMFSPEKWNAPDPAPPQQRAFTLMYHGLLVERHGLDLAVRAMAQVVGRVPNIKLHIYGKPTEYMEGVMQLVRKLGLQDIVQYKGFKSLPEIAQTLTTIDLGLVPNRLNAFTQINFPTRIFECLAMNKPVLVPRTQGIGDYFDDNNILFFEPGNIDELARKIEWASQNPGALRQVMERGREVYRKHCWDSEEVEFIGNVQKLCAARTADVPVRGAKSRRICMVAFSNYENDNRVMRYAEELARRGDHVEVLTLKREKGQPTKEIINGVHVCRVQRRSRKDQQTRFSYVLPLLKFFLLSSARLTWRHFKKPYDVIHVHNMPDFLVFAAWFPKLTGCKIILDIHDIVPEFYASKFDIPAHSRGVNLLKNIERASAHFSNHVIVSNHLWLDTFAARNSAKDKSSVFINNVDPEIFHPGPRRPDDGKFIILFPGGLQWHQGLDIALRAFQKVTQKVDNAEFHIYGDGNMKPSLIELAHKLELDGKVQFFKPLSVRQIADVMAKADLGVVPKRADSFGDKAYSTKIMEFMAVGVPVIISSTTIDRYYFNDSVVRFFPSGDSDALAEAMLEMIADETSRRQMAARALEYAAQNSWETRKGDYLSLVDSLCVKNGRNGHAKNG